MDKETFKSYLERGKFVLSAKAKDEQMLKDKADSSLLPYPLFWLTNLGVASGMPPYISLIILLQVSIFFIPEFAWVSMGVAGKEFVVNWPEFIQYFVLNSTFPNSMYIFWVFSPFVLVICLVLYIKHIHGQGYDAFLTRRKILLGEKRSFSLSIKLALFVAIYLWMVFSNLGPPGFLRGFVPLKNKVAMMVFHGIQMSFILPAFIALIAAELRAEFSNLIKTNRKI